MNRRGLVFGVIILLISISSQIYAQDITTATAGPISLSADQNITVEDGGTVTNSDSAPSGVGPPTGVGIYGHDNSGGGGGGNRITVKSGGLVQTNGQGRANAIWVSGNQTDLGAVGFLDGSDANYITIESGGVVKTTGPRPNASWDGPNAIQLGNNNFLRNDGLLLSEGEDGNGIYAAYNNTIENNGTIRTLSDYGQGLYICFNNLITNDGLIETNGDDATAVYLHDDGNKVINTGTIITRGSASFGIHGLDSPNGSTIINNNSIYTYGYNGKAIRSARNSTVINNGLIETIGLGGQGIRAYYDNRVENHGRIVTRGESAMGILTAGGSTVIVTGEIETHGKKGDGVLYWDKDNTLHLSGSISVSGVDAYAIRTGFNGSETNNNTPILAGASISGDVANNSADNSPISFGYAKNSDGTANLGASDPNFSFTFNNQFIGQTMNFDCNFVGGITTFAQSTSGINNAVVGNIISGQGATLNIASGATINVGGNFTSGVDGVTQFTVEDDIAGKIKVAGVADFNNATIKVTGIEDPAGISRTLVEAGTLQNLSDGDVDIEDNSWAVDYYSEITPTTLTVYSQNRPNAFEDAGSTANNLAVGSVLDQVFQNDPTVLGEISDALVSLSSRSEVANAMKQLDSAPNSTGISGALAHAINQYTNTFSQQMSSFRSVGSLSKADIMRMKPLLLASLGAPANYFREQPPNKTRIFARIFGDSGYESTHDNIIGYDYETKGFCAGVDYLFIDGLRLGFLIGGSETSTDMRSIPARGVDKAIRFGPYIEFEKGALYIDGAITYGIHDIETTRNISFSGLSETAKSERDGDDINLFSELGYDIDKNGIHVTPYLKLQYTHLKDPAYSETGAGSGNLSVSERKFESLLKNIGIRAGKLLYLETGTSLFAEVWADWEHEYLDGSSNTTTRFVSAPSVSWNSTIPQSDNDRGNLGFGLTLNVNTFFSIFGQGNYKFWKHGSSRSANGGIRIHF